MRFFLHISCCILTFMSHNCYAEWTKVSGESGRLSGSYVDTGRIEEGGSYVTYWALYNYKEKTAEGYQSVLSKINVVCANKLYPYRTKKDYYYSLANQKGSIVDTWISRASPFEESTPGSVIEAQNKLICNELKWWNIF